MSSASLFKMGDQVETNERFKEQQTRLNKEYGFNISLFHTGYITHIKRVIFREAHIPDMVILTLDTGFRHNADMFSEVV